MKQPAQSWFRLTLRWIGRLFVATLIVSLTYLWVDSYNAQHAGPFAYFKATGAHPSSFDSGRAQIDERIAIGNKADDAMFKLKAAGFHCSPMLLDTNFNKTAKTNIAQYGSCRYGFGFLGRTWFIYIRSIDNKIQFAEQSVPQLTDL